MSISFGSLHLNEFTACVAGEILLSPEEMSLKTRDLAGLVVVHKVFRMVHHACLFYLELCHAKWFLGAPQFR